jgi:hypothetical protein
VAVDRVLPIAGICILGVLISWVLVQYSGRVVTLWIAAAVCAACVFGLGFADWTRLPSKETPLGVYLILAIIPTLVVTVVESLLASSRLGKTTRTAIGGVIWIGLGLASLLLSLIG